MLAIDGSATLQVDAATTAAAPLELVGGTLALNAGLTAKGGFAMGGGTVSGAGALTVPGALAWSGGTIGGTGLLTTLGATTLTQPYGGTLVLQRPWEMAGPVTWSSGHLQFDAPVHVQSGVAFESTNSGTYSVTGTGTLAVDGVVRKSGTASQSLAVPVVLGTGGELEVQQGQFTLTRGGATHGGVYDVWSGAVLSLQASGSAVTYVLDGGAGTGESAVVFNPVRENGPGRYPFVDCATFAAPSRDSRARI